jgi:hypothetical protein
MKDIPLKAGIQAQLLKTRLDDAHRDLVSGERGEVGSWLILAAGLVAAAVFAASQLDTWIRGKVDDITSQ